ncbi:MAG: hypothetical protein WCL08_01265, partial [Verrucomicrobiota bacterium]
MSDTTKPRVLMQGKLKLTRELEDRLMQHIMERRNGILDEMGWVAKGQYKSGSFLGKRDQYQREYANDFLHRQMHKGYGRLYQYFNTSMNVPKRAIRVYKARAAENLVDTEPFTGFMPEGEEDEGDSIKAAERYFHRKLKESEARHSFREGIEQCGIAGEAVIKIIKRPDPVNTQKEERIWMSQGQPLRDTRNRWVSESDDWEEDPTALQGQRLKRDPLVTKPEDAVLSEEVVNVTQAVKKTQLDMQALSSFDFLCSPTAADIHTTDFIAHDFDFYLDQLLVQTADLKLNPEAKQWIENLKMSDDGRAKSNSGQPRENQGEVERKRDAPTMLHLEESYLRFDAADSGISVELYVLWDVDGQYPIYYDFLTEVSPTEKRPFEVMRIIKVKDRWSGIGFYELLSNEHPFIDRQLNRIDARESSSGRMTWMREGAIQEVQRGIAFEVPSLRVWTIDKSVEKVSEAFGFVALPAMDENIFKLLQIAMQAAQLMTGTMTPGDAEASNLDATKTATGINALSAESELMSGDTTQDLMRGIEASLRQAVIVIFHNYDEQEGNLLLGAETGELLKKWLADNKPENLLYHVRLLMTKSRSKTQMASNQQAINVIVGQVPWVQLVQMNPL